MELASNLLWVLISLVLLRLTYSAVRRGAIKLSMAPAMTVALMASFILLPAISVSDDLLAMQQAALPSSSQSWRMASDGCSSGFDVLPTGNVQIWLVVFPPPSNEVCPPRTVSPESVAVRLVRAQRLRPPLNLA